MPATQALIQIGRLSLVAPVPLQFWDGDRNSSLRRSTQLSAARTTQSHPCLRARFNFLALPGHGSGSLELSDLSPLCLPSWY